MPFLILSVAVFAIAFLLQLYFRRQTRSLPEPPARNLETTHLRPLFEPSHEDLKRQADEAGAREIARREYQRSAKVAARVDAAVNAWRLARDRSSAIELMRVASESGREGDLARAAREIIEFYRGSGIPGLTSDRLAILIDSHIKLLPAQERSSGDVFWLKEEVARLSSETKMAAPEGAAKN